MTANLPEQYEPPPTDTSWVKLERVGPLVDPAVIMMFGIFLALWVVAFVLVMTS